MIFNTGFLAQLLEKHATPGTIAYVTDANAHILASTKDSRIGTTSTTAQFILQSGRQAVIEHNDALQGGQDAERNTVTYGTPITILDEIIGTVVVFGAHAVAVALGQLVKTALETAMEYQSYTQSILHTSDKRSIVARALLDSSMTKPKIVTALNKLEMDPQLLRSVIYINLSHQRPNYFNINLNLGYQSSIERINEDIVKRIRACRFFNTQDMILAYDRNAILVIKSFIQNSDIGRAYLSLDKICEEIEVLLADFTSFTYHIAYGNIYPEIEDVRKSFSEAAETIRIGKQTHPEERVYILDKLLFDHVCHFIDAQVVNKIILPAMEALKSGESSFPVEIINTANAFVDNCMSFSRTAAATFQHRNTVGNRLDRLRQKTGLDPAKSFHDAFVVKMVWTYLALSDRQPEIEAENP